MMARSLRRGSIFNDRVVERWADRFIVRRWRRIMFETMLSTGRMRGILFRAVFYAAVGSACLLVVVARAAAGPLGQTRETIFIPPPDDAQIIEVVGRRGGGGVHRPAGVRPNRAGVRPNKVVVRNNNTVIRNTNALVRPGWVRPAHYTWRPGGAIAAGAAVGFVTAATAAAWAGAPPAPAYCWYYTDSSREQGFWDACP
jgi:hypothetical protein